MLLQIVAVHWGPAQVIFDTVDLSVSEWLLAAAVASSVLFLDEARKLLIVLFSRNNVDSAIPAGHER